ncbi:MULTISPECIES: glycosyltransferase family 2 protein [unclassified Bradyrhizobium]|uniref:glycosyltransferase family 2 protein n=1 Tax=Bradyrhizobium TaxID=374 RepID=UPI002916E621|nr:MULTISPECIES: glycosyltransferase family A protein [unclassified Bradyrhizobium]
MTTTAASQDQRLLSVAIPVYNFGAFLPETLDSVLDQALTKNVEVLVFDGGSSDNTLSVVRQYLKRYTNLRYVRALKKGGIDADMARSVELVSAPYCWLFSGDDVMLPGAIERVMESLKRWQPDLLLGRHNECLVDMSVLRDWPVLDFAEDKILDLYDPDDRRVYLDAARSSEAFFSFMGTLIVNRSRWFKYKPTSQFNGSNWAHIGRLWSMLNDPFKLVYLHDVLLHRRGGNDSFSNAGMLARLDIQINGLLNVVEEIFPPPSPETYHLRRVIRSEVEPHWANAVRQDLLSRHAPQSDFLRLDEMLNRIRP